MLRSEVAVTSQFSFLMQAEVLLAFRKNLQYKAINVEQQYKSQASFEVIAEQVRRMNPENENFVVSPTFRDIRPSFSIGLTYYFKKDHL